MGLSEANDLEDVRERPVVRARAIESLRVALEAPPKIQPDVPGQQTGLEIKQTSPDKKRDIAVAMGLAREAVATAAKAAEDELRHMRELLERAEARARASEARATETEMLLADIRDQLVAKVAQRRAA